ncbi:hypothetical protein C6N75_26400 [Streptomyces solincola]|uniref:Uncharacterized protein n=1 Tax=Streptomyces solincola TaxID=2100817 RepID=A0A2S9PPH2_9ACTN|nr:hypothetical protein C6N75_26400 [Streptomyces solincola]
MAPASEPAGGAASERNRLSNSAGVRRSPSAPPPAPRPGVPYAAACCPPGTGGRYWVASDAPAGSPGGTAPRKAVDSAACSGGSAPGPPSCPTGGRNWVASASPPPPEEAGAPASGGRGCAPAGGRPDCGGP